MLTSSIVLMMMFLSMTLTLLLGLTQRYNELIMQQTNDDAVRAIEDFTNQDFAGIVPSHTRGRGLHPQIINTLPEKVYHKNDINDVTIQNNSNEAECEEEEECCPICLGEFSLVTI